MTNLNLSRKQSQELPIPISPGDVIVGDRTEIEFRTYVEQTALVRFYDQFGREQSDGLASFKQWLGEQEELTIRRE